MTGIARSRRRPPRFTADLCAARARAAHRRYPSGGRDARVRMWWSAARCARLRMSSASAETRLSRVRVTHRCVLPSRRCCASARSARPDSASSWGARRSSRSGHHRPRVCGRRQAQLIRGTRTGERPHRRARGSRANWTIARTMANVIVTASTARVAPGVAVVRLYTPCQIRSSSDRRPRCTALALSASPDLPPRRAVYGPLANPGEVPSGQMDGAFVRARS